MNFLYKFFQILVNSVFQTFNAAYLYLNILYKFFQILVNSVFQTFNAAYLYLNILYTEPPPCRWRYRH